MRSEAKSGIESGEGVTGRAVSAIVVHRSSSIVFRCASWLIPTCAVNKGCDKAEL